MSEHTFQGEFRQVLYRERVAAPPTKVTAYPGDFIFEFEDGDPAFVVPHDQYERLTGEEPPEPEPVTLPAAEPEVEAAVEPETAATAKATKENDKPTATEAGPRKTTAKK